MAGNATVLLISLGVGAGWGGGRHGKGIVVEPGLEG